MAMVPTVGRVVHFYPNGDGAILQRRRVRGDTPWVGFICDVGDKLINVAGFDLDGMPFSCPGVKLITPGEEVCPGPGRAYAAWMPYQVQKATGGDHNSESAEPRPS